MRQRCTFPGYFPHTIAIFFLSVLCWESALAQDAAQKPAEKPAAKSAEKTIAPEKAVNPAQIELLETKVRFESNGDSRKEVHTVVKINNELGVRQFARLNFDFNRSFESIEIPLVHITHASGGTADILPSAITDQPNPAVVNAPAYQDVRVKSVRILGLQPGDALEYRVITTVSHHPLAPDFWLDHTFDRTGVVTRQNFEIDLPALEELQLRINPDTPVTSVEKSDVDSSARIVHRWQLSQADLRKSSKTPDSQEPDVLIARFGSWGYLSNKLDTLLTPRMDADTSVAAKTAELTGKAQGREEKLIAIYEFVSQKITTVDLPLGSTGFRTRPPWEILSSGMATEEDKYALFSALAASTGAPVRAFLAGAPDSTERLLPRLQPFTHLLIAIWGEKRSPWLDPGVEVVPFGLIPAEFRGKRALQIEDWGKVGAKYPLADIMFPTWVTVPIDLPFAAFQRVGVDASLAADGKLTAKVHYSMRGDNELLLRVAFHQMPKERWKELAQLLSITDGFRGEVSSVKASDPYATREPFTLDYEISMPKFVDWSKKTVRIPALLPQFGLPDPPAKPAAGAVVSAIDLGTPLEVEARMTLRLPVGTTPQTPTGISVQRDYATYASQYAAKGRTVSATRHIHFLSREVPAARAADYNAFLRAVQNDEAQDFTLERANPAPAGAKPAETKTPPPNKPGQTKP